MVVLDTSILIDHLRQSRNKETVLAKFSASTEETLAISIITIQELYEGKSTKTEERERALLSLISPIKILPYTYQAAKLAGEIARDLDKPIELADAAIAATTITDRAKLLTLNRKDFKGIKNLSLI